MEQGLLHPLREALAAGFRAAGYADVTTGDIRMPLHDRLWEKYRASASCYLPQFDGRALPFPAVWGAEAVEAVRFQSGWVLLTLTDGFFDACVREALRALPPVTSDGGEHALNRLLGLMRHGGTGCPPSPSVQRALWLSLAATGQRRARNRALAAVEQIMQGVPVDARMALTARMGQAADAMARLLICARGEGARSKQ